MGVLTELRYRTFESLFEDVRVDLKSLSLSNRIDPQNLIKVVQRVNYDLGLRIHQVKETILDIEHSKARLPLDFYVMNFALMCGEYTVTTAYPQGTQISEVTPNYTQWPDWSGTCHANPQVSPCDPTKLTWNGTKPVCLSQCGNAYQLVQTINSEVRTYKYMMPIKFRQSKDVQCDCPNLGWRSQDEAYISNGFIYINADDICGKMYINYEGTLEDIDGNLMVPDHPFLNEYYEYALKDRILENLLFDGDMNLQAMIQLVKGQLRAARNNALTVVNTPDFREMRNLHDLNRKAFYGKFYAMFASYPWGWSQEIYN
jgi:hypothetical protein